MVSDRLRAWIRIHFRPEDIEPVLALLAELRLEEPGSTNAGTERIHAAVLFLSDGDGQRFLDALVAALGDWRDVLVWADLAHDDWILRLNAELGGSAP